MDKAFSGNGSKMASDRLMKELASISEKNDFGYSAEPINDDLYHWQVKFFDFDKNSDLGKDLKKLKKNRGFDFIELDLRFPKDFPFAPIFIRIVKPRDSFIKWKDYCRREHLHGTFNSKRLEPLQ